jgi:PIN domain
VRFIAASRTPSFPKTSREKKTHAPRPRRWPLRSRKRRSRSQTKVAPIQQKIAIEAAEAPVATGHKDPGDCCLIATSRVRKIPIITRDPVMRKLATDGYLDVIVCRGAGIADVKLKSLDDDLTRLARGPTRSAADVTA